MRAVVSEAPAPIESEPLREVQLPDPEPGPGEILIRITRCGVCRTDLHVVEGDLPRKRARVVPGHEVVGRVAKLGAGCVRFKANDRVGVAWLRSTCGVCRYCRSNRENLCPAAVFNGYDYDGGYADMMVAPEAFCYSLPDALDDEQVAPLLCAGIIGFRAIRRAEVKPASTVGLYGFGASAHIALQVLKHWGCRVFVMSRAGLHRDLAAELGADWIGGPTEAPPALLQSAILFAPAGEIVPSALAALDRAGVLAIAGIHLSTIPPLDYRRHLFEERELRSVTANTRADGEEFLRIAAEIPVRSRTFSLSMGEANRALAMLKHDELRGAAVLTIR
jgi:propanol-preferring alcohol dehydrogenase